MLTALFQNKSKVVCVEGNGLAKPLPLGTICRAIILNLLVRYAFNCTKLKNNCFTKDNYPGDYTIYYSFVDESHEIVNSLHIKVTPLRSKESKKIKDLFPKHHLLTKYFKIRDVITDISECYTLHPTICMISIRTLIEISLKAFQEEIYNEQVDNSSTYDVDGKMKWIYTAVSQSDNRINSELIQEYKTKLASSHKKTIKYYKDLRPNIYIHEHDTIATSGEVFAAAKRFCLLLNFIIDALLLKQDNQNELEVLV